MTPRLSWKIGTLGQVQLRVDITFVVVVFYSLASSAGDAGIALGLGCTAAIAAHELGHALVAWGLRLSPSEITLSLVDGGGRVVATTRRQEVAVALAGPLANLTIAAAFALGLWQLAPSGPRWWEAESGAVCVLVRGLAASVGLAVVDLLPAFPLDGGRLLRAASTLRRDFTTATQLTAKVGRVVAVGLAIAGLVVSPLLWIVAFAVWRGGPRELALVASRRQSGEVEPVSVRVVSSEKS